MMRRCSWRSMMIRSRSQSLQREAHRDRAQVTKLAPMTLMTMKNKPRWSKRKQRKRHMKKCANLQNRTDLSLSSTRSRRTRMTSWSCMRRPRTLRSRRKSLMSSRKSMSRNSWSRCTCRHLLSFLRKNTRIASQLGLGSTKDFYRSKWKTTMRSRDASKGPKLWSRRWARASWTDRRDLGSRASDPVSEAAERASDLSAESEVTLIWDSWTVETQTSGTQTLSLLKTRSWSRRQPIMSKRRTRFRLRKYSKLIRTIARSHSATSSTLSIRRSFRRGRQTPSCTLASESRVIARMRSSIPTISISWFERAI